MNKYEEMNDLNELTNIIVQDWDTANIIEFAMNEELSQDNLDQLTIETIERSNQYNYYYLCRFANEIPNLSKKNINMIINKLLEISESLKHNRLYIKNSEHRLHNYLAFKYIDDEILKLIELINDKNDVVRVKRK